MMLLKKIIQLSLLFSAVVLYQNCGAFESSMDDAQLSSLGAISFKCTDDSIASETKSLLLSKTQYSNAISDLFGASVLQNISGALSGMADPINNLTSNERQSLISSAEVDSYHSVALAIAADVVGNKTKREAVFGTCSSLANPGASCIDGFLTNFAIKIFRRPLTLAESTFAKNLANSGGTYITNLEAVLAYFLESPHFVWRLELGEGGVHTPEKTYLTQYEIASRISFSTIDSIPDGALLTAASQGQLSSISEIKKQTERLLNTARGQNKVANMLAWWSLSDRSKDMSNLPVDLTAGLNLVGIDQAISDEAKIFIKDVVYKDQGSFQDLLTSKKSFATHSGLAQVYGHSPVLGNGVAQFSGRRQGLLMRAAFLSHDTFRTSIIHRGVDFQKRFLCNNIPSPNVNIAADRDNDALTHAELMDTSNREAIAHQTKSPVCMGCHSTINPTGFAFENFDSFGRIRYMEMIFETDGSHFQDLPINTSTSVPFPGNQMVEVSDAYDLVEQVATSSVGAACMTRNFYRYFNEKSETSADDCELERTYKILSQSDQPILQALVNMIANDHIGEKVH